MVQVMVQALIAVQCWFPESSPIAGDWLRQPRVQLHQLNQPLLPLKRPQVPDDLPSDLDACQLPKTQQPAAHGSSVSWAVHLLLGLSYLVLLQQAQGQLECAAALKLLSASAERSSLHPVLGQWELCGHSCSLAAPAHFSGSVL